MPFQYEGYRSPFANSIAELMLRRGDIAARQAEQSGNAWAGAAQTIGQSVAAMPAQIQQAQRAQLVDANLASEITDRNAQATQRTAALKANTAVDQIMQTSLKQDPTTGVFSFDRPSFEQGLIQGGMGHLYPTLAETLDKLDASATKRNAEGRTMLAETLVGIGKAGYTPQSVLSGAAFLKANQVITNDHLQPVLDAITADPSPANIQAVVTKLGTAIPEYGKLLDAEETRKAGLAKTTADTAKLTADTAKATAEADKFAAEAANLKQYGSATKPNFEQKNVTLDGKANQLVNFDPRSGQMFLPGSSDPINVSRVKANPPASMQVNVGQQNDVKETVAGMRDGSLPPQLPGRASKEYVALMAEAHRQGYDLATAAQDWTATQKHLATLNGAQQTRLRQAILTASDSLGVIEDLATQWDGGKFPLLNKANLALAKAGGLGAKAQQIATNLEAQITDVTSELGNVYMGGNSPTDHALSLAGKNLSADWTKDQLLSAIKLARTNLQIRTNSITNAGAITASSQQTPTPTVNTAAPNEGTEGVVNGVAAIWKTVNGKTGWWKK